jgi:hypothetical protein
MSVQVPRISWPGPSTAQLVRVGLADFPAPLADRLVVDARPAFCEQFLHVAIAEREAEVQSGRVTDDRGREAMALVAGRVLIRVPSIAYPAALPLGFSCADSLASFQPCTLISPADKEKIAYGNAERLFKM